MASFELDRLSGTDLSLQARGRSVSVDERRVSSPSLDRGQLDIDAITPAGDNVPLGQGQGSPLLRTGHGDSAETTSSVGKKSSQTTNVEKEPTLRYRRRSLCLLGCYLPCLIVPWALTCVLAIRPLSFHSYYNQMGQFGADTYLVILFWMGFVRVLNAIASVLTVPVTSALLAQGAVVYSQRRKIKQALTLRQTFAFADRAWADVPAMWAAKNGNGTGSKYLWLAAGLLTLSAVQAPIQQALVASETITIMTCNDNPVFDFSGSCNPLRFPTVAAYDPEPADLAQTPQNPVVLEVIKSLATVNDLAPQLHMWHDPQTSGGNVDDDNMPESNGFFWYYESTQPGSPTFFVSAVPNATTTGVLREHAMRLNSSVECTLIDRSAFPSACVGDLPLVKSFSRSSNMSIDICVPGDYSKNPWSLSRDRQNLTEELYVDVFVPYESKLNGYFDDTFYNFTAHCTANTSRGYFELGNYRNNYTAGPLIDKWPDNETMWKDFNDYQGALAGYNVPQTIDNVSSFPAWAPGLDPFETYELATPGPLMTSALAMFGNGSFFYVAMNSSSASYPPAVTQICQAGNIPFLRMNLGSDLEFMGTYSACEHINEAYNEEFNSGDLELEYMLFDWFQIFNRTTLADGGFGGSAVELLNVAIFKANEAWLTQTADATWFTTARAIYTSPGSPVFRPAKTLAGTIIISTLIGLQVIGLLVLAWYIYTVPTWTTQIDAFAVARLAKTLPDHVLPPLGPVTEEDLEKLRKADGLIGVADDSSKAKNSSSDVPAVQVGDHASKTASTDVEESSSPLTLGIDAVTDGTATSSGIRLERGGPGRITKHHAPPPKKKKAVKKTAPRRLPHASAV